MTKADFGADRLIAGLRTALHTLGPSAADLIPAPLGQPIPAARPASLPVLEDMDGLVAHAPAGCAEALHALSAVAPALDWRQTYARPAVSEHFLQNYGYTELIGASAPYRNPQVSIGILLLGPDTLYPRHQHEALEQYAPLSGQAEWFDQDTGWRRVKPPALIVHRPWVIHAMRTRTEPLMAFYRWSGPGVSGHARLVG